MILIKTAIFHLSHNYKGPYQGYVTGGQMSPHQTNEMYNCFIYFKCAHMSYIFTKE